MNELTVPAYFPMKTEQFKVDLFHSRESHLEVINVSIIYRLYQ